jgi:hypothetical protein
LVAGAQIDEDGFIYFTTRRTRAVAGKPFLAGRGGNFGAPVARGNSDPFTGTYVKADPKKLKVLLKNAIVPLEQPPARQVDAGGRKSGEAWIEGAEWLYAGASPIVPGGCSCPSQRAHLDWYKRSYVPEAYRNSIGILDTNGNLIMHLGRYANFDTAPGGRDGAKPGDTDIGTTAPRFIAGTDNYLCFEDWGEKIVVLKLDYHTGETASIAD